MIIYRINHVCHFNCVFRAVFVCVICHGTLFIIIIIVTIITIITIIIITIVIVIMAFLL